MSQPVLFTLRVHHGLWRLERDGGHPVDYSHLDQATHEAVAQARALVETGAPARVVVHAAEGREVEIDVEAEVTQEQALNGPLPDG